MTLTAVDSAYPLAQPLTVDIACVYGAGGDPVHIWTPAEVAAQPARYRLPICVQSDPGPASHIATAHAFLTWLASVGCPSGSSVVLDLETGVTPTYVNGFGTILHEHGYFVLPYGSASTLFRNPRLDGYFLADPGATEIPANCVAVQYAYLDTYDLSLVTASVPLWDTQPAPAPVPVPSIPGKGDLAVLILRTSTNGPAYLFAAGKLVGLKDGPTLTALQGAGVGTAEIASVADFQAILAALA